MISFYIIFISSIYILEAETIYPSNTYNYKDTSNSADSYSFILSGHLYGSPHNKDSVFPSSSLLANIESIKNSNYSFFISCGDIFRKSDSLNILNFKNSFLNKLNIPFYNAVGNHDVTDRNLYKKYFGETYFKFTQSSELYIFLDSELADGIEIANQLQFFSESIKVALFDDSIKNIFIFSHKLIWAQLYDKYHSIYDNVNSKIGYSDNHSFTERVLAELKSNKVKNIYWASGDLGVKTSMPFFYYDKNLNVTFIATGIGDTKDDNVISVLLRNSKPEFSIVNLSNNTELNNIESFGIKRWNKAHNKQYTILQKLQNFNAKLKRLISNKYFFIGLSLGFLIPIIFIKKIAILYDHLLIIYKKFNQN